MMWVLSWLFEYEASTASSGLGFGGSVQREECKLGESREELTKRDSVFESLTSSELVHSSICHIRI